MTEKKTAEDGYELIPMSEITDEAREIAVRWMECNDKDWIGQKHKLASDIMNYAKKYAAQQSDEIAELKKSVNLLHEAMVTAEKRGHNKAMEEYAARQSKMPTEDQIHEWAYNYCMMPGMPEGEPEPDMQIYSAFCDGVEWLRKQIER